MLSAAIAATDGRLEISDPPSLEDLKALRAWLKDANGQYRLSYDAPVSNADMLQTFLPAFESVVKGPKIRGIMCGMPSAHTG